MECINKNEKGTSSLNDNKSVETSGLSQPARVATKATNEVGLMTDPCKAEMALQILRDKLEALVGFIIEKKNIHKELKSMARATNRALIEYDKTRPVIGSGQVARSSQDGQCQTSPLFSRSNPQHAPIEHERPSPPKVLKSKKARTEKAVLPPLGVSDQRRQPTGNGDSEWMQVVNRKKQKGHSPIAPPTTENSTRSKVRVRRGRPDAIKIKTSGELSYADILRKMRTASDLKPLGERVTRIRRTKVGELLLELGKPGRQTEELYTAVSSTLEKAAEVCTLTHREVLTIRDMDEATKVEEIADAITAMVGPGVVKPQQVQLRKSYRGTQAANVMLPVAVANKLLQAGKLRIGWVNCRICLHEKVSRCFRCHEIGHLARDCKSAVDRSAQCFRCRKEGHKVADCPSKSGAGVQEVESPVTNG